MAAPMIIPSRLLGGIHAPSNRVRVGHIGAGRIASGHDMPGVANADLADVLAVCDLDSRRAEAGKRRLARLDAAKTSPLADVQGYTGYHQPLARPAIDAGTIKNTDHW